MLRGRSKRDSGFINNQRYLYLAENLGLSLKPFYTAAHPGLTITGYSYKDKIMKKTLITIALSLTSLVVPLAWSANAQDSS